MWQGKTKLTGVEGIRYSSRSLVEVRFKGKNNHRLFENRDIVEGILGWGLLVVLYRETKRIRFSQKVKVNFFSRVTF